MNSETISGAPPAKLFFSFSLVFCLPLALLFLTLGAPPAAYSAPSYTISGAPPTIFVNAIAEKSVDPNMVILNIETYGKAKNAKEAQDLQAKEYTKVKNIIEKFKVKKEDFTTGDYSITPEYTYDQKTQNSKITGYKVSHQIKVTLRKIESTGELLDALTSNSKVEISGSVIQSINWDSDKKSSVESAAMTEAVKIARQKAESLASAAGVKIKSVYNITHNTGSVDIIRPQLEIARTKTMSFANSLGGASTEVNANSIKVRSEVSMQFLIID